MEKILIKQGDVETSLLEKFAKTDALYEVSGTLDLKGGEVNVPEGCVVHFEAGSRIINGILVLNNTQFTGAKHSIATEVSGTQYELDTDDFDLTNTNKVNIMQSIVNTATSIQLHGRLENVFDNIAINKATSLIGYGAVIINNTQITSAINISTDDFVRITDLDFEISSGNAIYKNATVTNDAKLSFIISNCKFKLTSNNTSASLIKLDYSREGNITDCFFTGYAYIGSSTGVEYRRGIGIERKDAVNTNVIGCMFSYLHYGIKATAVHVTPDSDHPGDADDELYSKYACGLNVQSAVMISCKYGIYIEGNDSFFLNNSMIDFCENPLVLKSQDGANITDNYFSTASVIFNGATMPAYNATIAVCNNLSKTDANRNQRVIISGNTIYGHRTNNNYGIDMHVESKDCTIQGNTIASCTNVGIHLVRGKSTWSIEKLVIDNNRLYLSENCFYGIGNESTDIETKFEGDSQIVLSNNRAISKILGQALVAAASRKYGFYLYHNNHFRKAGNPPTDPLENKVFYENEKSTTRLKLQLSIPSGSNSCQIPNPMGDDFNIAVYIANSNSPAPIYISFNTNMQTISFGTSYSLGISFTAIIEHLRNI